MLRSVLLLCVCLVFVAVCQPPAHAQNNTNNMPSAITPDLLLKLGVDHRNPLLQLLGTAFQDTTKAIEQKVKDREMDIFQDTAFPDNATFLSHVCDLLECSDWTEWSECETGAFEFSMIKRERQCGFSNPLCNYVNVEQRTESQSKVCRKGGVGPGGHMPSGPLVCPSGYEKIHGKYCLKYYSSTTSRESAFGTCQSDGADLINVDTAEKDAALQEILRDHGVGSSVIWLNGKRDDKYSPWEFTYGRQSLGSSDWSKWSSNEPSNGSSELCMVEEGGDRVWWDRECSYSYAYVCEFV